MTAVRVADIERAIAASFPTERAESWDRVGLLAGDPESPVRGVLLALDPTLKAVRAAHERGANVLVTHHPAFLTPPHAILAGGAAGSGVVFEALACGVALINAHTNLDRDARAQRLIPEALDLSPEGPLERAPQARSVVTVFVPNGSAERVIEAMSSAGAGRVGDYEGCSFRTSGTGSFTPPLNAHPAVGIAGTASEAVEVRVEMVCPNARAEAVVAAAAAAHPYEEPLVVVTEAAIAPNAAALGMLSAVKVHDVTLGTLARNAALAYGIAPRVWGEPNAPVQRVASATGSAGSLVGAAISSGANALVAGEVRYHDALDAVAAGLGVIELGHDVSEWPLVGLLEASVREVPGLDPAVVTVLESGAGWWTCEPSTRS